MLLWCQSLNEIVCSSDWSGCTRWEEIKSEKQNPSIVGNRFFGAIVCVLLSLFSYSGWGQSPPDIPPQPQKSESATQTKNETENNSVTIPHTIEEGQGVTTIVPKRQKEKTAIKRLKDFFSFTPLSHSQKALICSIIPGGGQIYNQQYWKLPIVLGGCTACYYAISWNNNTLQEYAQAYRDIKSDEPLEHTSWQDFIPYGIDPKRYVSNAAFHGQLKRGRDFYRRNRDLSIIVSVGVYLLLMIDTYVESELMDFDISPDISASITPTILQTSPQPTPQNRRVGLQVALTF